VTAQPPCSRQGDPLWTRQIFVCTNVREPDHPRVCCGNAAALEVVAAFKAALIRYGLAQTVRAGKSGCLEACEAGPAAVVYPDATWYRVATPVDAERIVREHLVGGRVVQELLLDLAPLPVVRARDKAQSGANNPSEISGI